MELSEYSDLDAVALVERVRSGEVSSRALAELALEAVAAVNPRLNAVIAVYADRVERLAAGREQGGPLQGIPFLNKDLTPEGGSLLEMGSELARGYVAKVSCELLRKLSAAGAHNLGRTTTPEFGLGSVTESTATGITRNPWNLSRTPGGSSGGSAAMVAAGAVPIATASDGGGSIRGPAARCGLVGLKPTRGRISPGPVIDEPICGLAIGFVLTRSVRDSALVLDATHGMSAGDAYGIQNPARPFMEELCPPRRRLRVGYTTTSWAGQLADTAACAAVAKAVRALEEQGHFVEEARPQFDAEALDRATLDIWCLNTAYVADALAAELGRTVGPHTLQSSTLSFYQRGRSVSGADIMRALSVYNDVNLQVGQFFTRYDVLVTPTCMGPADPIGVVDCNPPGTIDAAAWSAHMNTADAFMPPFNTTGNPAISLPLHWSHDGLPVGVQFIAAFADEATLFQLATFFEQALPWKLRRPPVHVFNEKK